MLIFASRCIKKGEEICHVYQGHFGDTDKEKRQNVLREMFHFECNCDACTNEYPKASQLQKDYASTGKDTDTKEKTAQLKQLDEKHEEINQKLFDAQEKYDVDLMFKLYCHRLRLAKGVLKSPHLIFLMGRAAIIDCLWIKYGNRLQFSRPFYLEGVYK